jgi:hypothetical protein
MQALSITPGFFYRIPQDQNDLTVRSLEVIVQPPQLGGMAAALHSNKLTYEEQIHIGFVSVIGKRYFGTITSSQVEF